MPPKAIYPRIVVAEDDESIREMLRLRLVQSGFRVTTARDGLEAVATILTVLPDVAIIDLNMPKLDGVAAMTQVHNMGLSTPVLMLTASRAEADVEKCLLAGAKDYVVKPFEYELLEHRLQRLVRTARQPAPGGVRQMIW